MNVGLVKLSSLGDVVHALPVAVALRTQRPGTRIAWIVEAREAAVLRGHEAIDEIVAVDTRRWRRMRSAAGILDAIREMAGLRRRLHAARFDVTLDLQGLLKSGLVSAATGASVRIGFAAGRCREPVSALFSNHRITPPDSARHVVEQYVALLEPLGIADPHPEFQIPVDAGAETRIDGVLTALGLKPRDRLVVVNPGAGRAEKRWPAHHYGELVRRLREEAAATTIVVWGPGEHDTAEAIATTSAAAVLAPATSIPELAALVRRATVVLAGDTGPLHLAAAVGTPCVGLYGPTRAERNGPYGRGHRVLQSPDGTMASISVTAVLAATMDAIG